MFGIIFISSTNINWGYCRFSGRYSSEMLQQNVLRLASVARVAPQKRGCERRGGSGPSQLQPPADREIYNSLHARPPFVTNKLSTYLFPPNSSLVIIFAFVQLRVRTKPARELKKCTVEACDEAHPSSSVAQCLTLVVCSGRLRQGQSLKTMYFKYDAVSSRSWLLCNHQVNCITLQGCCSGRKVSACNLTYH